MFHLRQERMTLMILNSLIFKVRLLRDRQELSLSRVASIAYRGVWRTLWQHLMKN